MSDHTYLYRAVLTKPREIIVQEWEDGELHEYPDVIPAGTALGRRSGYLSRSGASRWAAEDVEIVRSEPVVFLTREQKLRNEIGRLTAELDALTG